MSFGYERQQTPDAPKLCASCGEPAHRFGPDDPQHDYDPTACVNSLLWRKGRLREALFGLSCAVETAWPAPDVWPDYLLAADNEARRLTDNLGDLP